MALNKVLLIGNVGKDPDIRHLEGGASVATITIATSERFKDRNGETKELTEWHTVVAWRQLADFAEKFIKKGAQIYVEGRIRSRSYDDQNGNKRYVTEILADSVQLLGRKSDNGSIPTGGAYDGGGYTGGRGGYQSPVAPVRTAETADVKAVAPQTNDLDPEGADDLPF